MKQAQVQDWTVLIAPKITNIFDRDSYEDYQRYADLSALLYTFTSNIDFDIDSQGIMHLVFDRIKPSTEKMIYRLLGETYFHEQEDYDREIRLMTTLAEAINEDYIIQVGLEFDDGTYELRTFEDIEVNLALSCMTLEEDINDINLRCLTSGHSAVPFVDNLFLAVGYKQLHIEESSKRIATGYIHGVPVDGLSYVARMGNWLEMSLK